MYPRNSSVFAFSSSSESEEVHLVDLFDQRLALAHAVLIAEESLGIGANKPGNQFRPVKATRTEPDWNPATA